MTSALGGGTQKEHEVREATCILYTRSVPTADKRGSGVKISKTVADVIYHWPPNIWVVKVGGLRDGSKFPGHKQVVCKFRLGVTGCLSPDLGTVHK